MTFPLSSRSSQISIPNRSSAIEFEPLLDAVEAAALLRMHPNTLRMKARLGEIPGRHVGKYWRFRISDLNNWIGRQEQGRRCASQLMPNGAPAVAAFCAGGREELIR